MMGASTHARFSAVARCALLAATVMSDDEPDESQWPALISLGEVLIAVYLPFAWTLFSKAPVLTGHRIGSFLVMPTFAPQALLYALTGSPVWELLCPMLGIFTVAGLACWGRHGGAKRIAAIAYALGGSVLLSIATVFLPQLEHLVLRAVGLH
jgi:hypothetical protein